MKITKRIRDAFVLASAALACTSLARGHGWDEREMSSLAARA
jgi:hypothetical protein